MKYIVIRHTMFRNVVREIPIIFPNELVHAEVFEAIRNSAALPVGKFKVVSAGSINSIGMNLIDCYGESESLKVKSREKDDVSLIVGFDYSHGLV